MLDSSKWMGAQADVTGPRPDMTGVQPDTTGAQVDEVGMHVPDQAVRKMLENQVDVDQLMIPRADGRDVAAAAAAQDAVDNLAQIRQDMAQESVERKKADEETRAYTKKWNKISVGLVFASGIFGAVLTKLIDVIWPVLIAYLTAP